MRIQDLELLIGMDRATIRFYEKEGLISPIREENGYRCYSNEDLQLLQKVKLLRKLGVSLQKIKALQQGSEDFSDVLQQQIELLENKISEDTAAKNVCMEMQRNRADYYTLDSCRYLEMLEKPRSNQSEFQESIVREHHPWRRYFARMLDYGLVLAVIEFVVVVVLGVRPYNTGLQMLLKYGSYLLAVPCLALFISKWGTTPGKWVMGIRLESYDGGKLDFATAFDREKSLLWYGFGLFIPFYDIWRQYRSYKTDTEGKKNEWNCDTEISFLDWSVIKKIGVGIVVAVTLLLSTVSIVNAVMPPNRYQEMTVSQFAKNYNTYVDIVDIDDHLMLDNNGKWTKMQTDGERIDIGEEVDYVRPEFQYTLDGKIISAVQYTEIRENESFIGNVIPNHCAIAIYTMVGSRPGAGYQELRQVDGLIKELHLSIEKGNTKDEKRIGDVVISWELQLSNWDLAQNGMLIASDANNTMYKLSIRMEIRRD